MDDSSCDEYGVSPRMIQIVLKGGRGFKLCLIGCQSMEDSIGIELSASWEKNQVVRNEVSVGGGTTWGTMSVNRSRIEVMLDRVSDMGGLKWR